MWESTHEQQCATELVQHRGHVCTPFHCQFFDLEVETIFVQPREARTIGPEVMSKSIMEVIISVAEAVEPTTPIDSATFDCIFV